MRSLLRGSIGLSRSYYTSHFDDKCEIETDAWSFSAFQRGMQSTEAPSTCQGYSVYSILRPLSHLYHIHFLSLSHIHTAAHRKSVLVWAGVCLWGYVEAGWKAEEVKGGEEFRDRLTHPFFFSVRVQPVVHSLDHTPPANTQTTHSFLLRGDKQHRHNAASVRSQ